MPQDLEPDAPMNDAEPILVLLVEDQEYRAEKITVWLRHPRVRILRARTPAEAIVVMRRTEMTLVLLDYDLDQALPEDTPATQNGGHVAAVIARLPARLQPNFVVIHSMNDAGRAEMLRVLEAAEIPAEVRPMDSWDDAYAGRLLLELLES
jgi:DNA-binding NarL/FixJ family response regulator